MGIVERAQAESTETSGALQGGRTASFLSSEEQVGASEGDALIESLQRDEPAAPGSVSEASRATTPVEPSGAGERVLDELLADNDADAASSPSAPATPAPERPSGHDDSVIDDLLGDDGRSRGS